MNQPQDKKKPIPYSCRKRQLVEMYLDQMPEATIKDNINQIILDNRKTRPSHKGKSPRRIIGTQVVWHTELVEFIETYGLPKGYFNENND